MDFLLTKQFITLGSWNFFQHGSSTQNLVRITFINTYFLVVYVVWFSANTFFQAGEEDILEFTLESTD